MQSAAAVAERGLRQSVLYIQHGAQLCNRVLRARRNNAGGSPQQHSRWH
jgi:hypothetical protein